MDLENIVDSYIQDSVLISERMPKGKSVYVPKNIREKLKLKDGQYVYLIINSFMHPAAFFRTVIAVPNILRKLVENDKTIKISISFINNKELLFLSCFRLVTCDHVLACYNLQTHQLIKKNAYLKLFCKNVFFYGTSCRHRISFSIKSLKRLKLTPFNVYQFLSQSCNKKINNEHLFRSNPNLNFKECITSKSIALSKLLPDFEIKECGKKMEVYYETRCKDSKKIKLNKIIKLSPEFLIALGLYQAEGTKTNQNYICFTNNDPNQVKFFKKTVTKHLKISNDLWRIDVVTSRNKEQIEKFWCNKLQLKPSQVNVRYEERRKSKYGSANLRITNNTIREILYRLLDLVKQQILLNEDFCGFFISGVLAGDGYLQLEGNKVKRVEMYFNPHKLKEEFFLYQDCLNVLNIKNYYVRIPYPKGNLFLENKAKQIVLKLKERFNKVKSQPTTPSMLGIGGVITIHRKEDLIKLYPYNLFYPNRRHHERFYKNFNLKNDNKIRRLTW